MVKLSSWKTTLESQSLNGLERRASGYTGLRMLKMELPARRMDWWMTWREFWDRVRWRQMICCGDPEGGLPKEEERPDEYISVWTENDWLLKITFIVICQSIDSVALWASKEQAYFSWCFGYMIWLEPDEFGGWVSILDCVLLAVPEKQYSGVQYLTREELPTAAALSQCLII